MGLASAEVTPGGSLGIAVTIHNIRPTPLILQAQHCGAPALFSAFLEYPTDPPGRVWSGRAADFKAFALGQAEQQGQIAPTPFEADATPCADGGWVVTVPPGGTTTSSLLWRAQLVGGVPALPAQAALFTVSVGYDPTCSPPPGRFCGPVGSQGGTVFSWSWTFRQVTLAGTFNIAGPPPKLISAGQAVDAVLASSRFDAWLATEPESTWTISNVMLLNYGPAQGFVPAGPNWIVDLFRQTGVPRNWANGYVDPFTGKLRNLVICATPCWR